MAKKSGAKPAKNQKFNLKSKMTPKGDQPGAIKDLVGGLKKGTTDQIVHGVTGSGKTFVMANVVQEIQKPTLVLSHNKTLAAQLCAEFQEMFPDNAVSYFVSYYDYYQPEAYMPATDTYIEKDASINEEIAKLRHQATSNLLTRNDVLIVGTVSCIYGLGSVDDYNELAVTIKKGDVIQRDVLLRKLAEMQYMRSGLEFKNGMFHVLGDTVEIYPPDKDNVYRIEFFGDDIEGISEVEAFTGEIVKSMDEVTVFPAKHDVTTEAKIKNAVEWVRKDLDERYTQLRAIGKNIEAERIKTRTEYDIEIMLETGYCSGIENYTRFLHGNGNRPSAPDTQPTTLMDYFPDDFLLFIDESHITVPQIGAMHEGNLSRKNTLIEHGFRLPSAKDNRPLRFSEFEGFMKQAVYVTATPGKYETAKTKKSDVTELVVRPTGLLDPPIEVRPSEGQIQDLLKEIHGRVRSKERVLVTTLTKRSAEDLAEFLADADVRVRYLHSDVDTLERIEILRDLRLGKFDVLVGINLLREGLDLPEVSLVAILDADKRGFLRSESALIQTSGRCARNVNGLVIMYGDQITPAMKATIDETGRRRERQKAYNKKHGITPATIKKAVKDIAMHGKSDKSRGKRKVDAKKIPQDELVKYIKYLESQMEMAAQNMEFEKAAEFRDQVEDLKGGL
jgi:excinuclease ABC subunit B